MSIRDRYLITKSEFNELKRMIRHKRKPGIIFEFEQAITVIEEENELILKPERKRLSREEKLALSKELAGSADSFSLEGIEETIRIANREYDREEEE